MGGRDPPFTPQIVISGWTTGEVRALWESKEPLWRMRYFQHYQSFQFHYLKMLMHFIHSLLLTTSALPAFVNKALPLAFINAYYNH